MTPEENAYHELCAWTLSRGDATFIHQHVVDAYAAQHADENSKPIGVAFALIGLYLHVEKKLTGKEVQREHMRLARTKRQWPRVALPASRGEITPIDVLRAPEGPERVRAIDAWCESVWKAFRENREMIARLVETGE